MRPKTKFMLALTAGAAFALPQAAMAQKTVSGGSGNMQWTAAQRLIGQTPTSDAATGGGGDSLYFPNRPQHNGVVALIMQYAAGSFICSGSLSSDRRHIITAAHCVSDGAGTANPLKTTAYFFDGSANDRMPFNPAATAIEVSAYNVNAGYTGEVIDQNDLAVLTLKDFAPSFATGYEVDFSGGLDGAEFNIAGVGGRSTIGGAFGVNANTGYLRQGNNIFDYALGDSEFGGFFTDRDGAGEAFFGFADYEHSYLSDFDNGLAANDQACIVAAALGASAGFGCDTGLGAIEVGVAGGDSGGPQFINGKLVSVTSYGLSFGTNFGDFRTGLNSSWGEYSGYVPLYIHKDFITQALSSVPEPASWAMMLAGFGMIGGAVRRSRKTVAAQAA
jgi:hypothetical protein